MTALELALKRIREMEQAINRPISPTKEYWKNELVAIRILIQATIGANAS